MRTLLALILIAAFAASPVRADSITLVADSWCPYNCEEGADAPGYLIDIAREALSFSGHTLTYQEMSWTRAIYQVQRGAAHGLVGAVPNEVPDFIFPKLALGLVPNAFFTLTESAWKPTDKDAFSSVRLGVIRDYDYGSRLQAWIDQHINTILVQEAQGNNALETNLRKLVHGRIDVVVDQKASVLAKAREMGIADQIRLACEDPVKPEEDSLYIAFSPVLERSRQYADDLDKGVRMLREQGRLQIILKAYGLEDWEPSVGGTP
ncbi:substrate-binding periplasmic protein [Desulfovibrio psychrotolerans]|uniref:ABC transporter substrate-binding protein n=1 Tax=Desulfovibrio psychrotolerans TaxID=415242 RepID=A0A7J0BX26_9BACT|nr:transporter substrate-binding domain-containing protein [Desulfovibrio psychrotolerans]GFM38243.1 hypothetical protein DSM19430T_29270 [Desulfovibrio psychrotolerans]